MVNLIKHTLVFIGCIRRKQFLLIKCLWIIICIGWKDRISIRIQKNDFQNLDYLPARSATFVTNAVSHAKRLAAAGNRVILIGGELKGTTEAVIGSQAILTIQGYHFTKGFFGTNGVSKRHGFTTPDPNEALVKQEAMRQTERCYVLADSQKFGMVSSVTFGVFEEATILTETEPPEGFSGSKNIRVAK